MLNNIKVLDLSHVFPGHFAGQVLGDLGAEVIKIEDPRKPDLLRTFTPKIGGESAFYLAVNRNKKSLALDIKTQEGKEIFLKLVQEADILLENFRPGHMEKLDLGYKALREINPSLIYCNISGFGNHPAINYNRGAHDLNFISESGILAATSSADGAPVMPGISIGAFSGGFYAVIAILTALYERSLTGQGTAIHSSIFDGMLQMASIASSKVDPAYDEQMPINNYIYPAKDGAHVALAAIEKKFWRNFLSAIERLDLLPAHGSKATQDNPAFIELKRIFSSKTQAEWYEALKDVDCCFSPIWDFSDALSSPYIEAKSLTMDIKHAAAGLLKQFPLPFTFSQENEQKKDAPPSHGEHTQEILTGIGYSSNEILALLEKGIIKQ